jgi:ribonuclease P protein component
MGGLLADRLKNRADFLRAQRCVRKSTAGLTLEACPTPETDARKGRFRLGFTASRKVGGAVERNRAKRRLRAAAQAILPGSAQECTDYVLIARTATLERPFPDLLKDLVSALAAAHVKLHGRKDNLDGNS